MKTRISAATALLALAAATASALPAQERVAVQPEDYGQWESLVFVPVASYGKVGPLNGASSSLSWEVRTVFDR